jgi:hypothetical protein
MPAHHAAIGNVAHGHAAREIRPFRLRLFSAEGAAVGTLREGRDGALDLAGIAHIDGAQLHAQ